MKLTEFKNITGLSIKTARWLIKEKLVAQGNFTFIYTADEILP